MAALLAAHAAFGFLPGSEGFSVTATEDLRLDLPPGLLETYGAPIEIAESRSPAS